MFRISMLLLVAACSNQFLSAQASADELIVKAAYAKLSLAFRIGAIHKRMSMAERTPSISALPVITLSNMKSGPLAEITNVPMDLLLTKPSGLVLQTTVGTWKEAASYDEVERSSTIAHATWKVADARWVGDWSLPMAKLIEALEPGIGRYVSYHAKIVFEGRERSYPAMFLLGVGVNGKPPILPLDHIIGSAVSSIIRRPIFPGALLGRRLLSEPSVQELLRSIQAPTACVEEVVTGLCCDPVSAACGINMPAFTADAGSARLQ